MLRRLETSSRVRTSAAHLQLGGRALRTYLPAPLGRLRMRGRGVTSHTCKIQTRARLHADAGQQRGRGFALACRCLTAWCRT